MTRTRYRIYEVNAPHFLTCTVVGWLPLFTRPEAVHLLLDSLLFLQQNREFKLFGYVILENHVPRIAAAADLPGAIKSFKMFTARRLITLLDEHAAFVLLQQLNYYKLRHKRRSTYPVWQEGSQPKQILDDDMMRQKLEYIHTNPVQRGYVDQADHGRYSSARNYAGLTGLIDVVTNWRGE